MLTVPRRFRVYFKAPTHADCAEKISCILRHLHMLTVPRRFRVF